ncbi:PQQ-dependent sugar dehydrogenase [Sphingomonas qomolangmaensis]|uniref:Sorbosone dehydrogenase family protein n=1 Tax=Sphingomonas qomolangmaensis TaxID=2918765 RepID=A0ABY5L405_9SPHN|nr:sorbosone dehydrogenase family protein [Sphingomonas qomolangmaensis]UUL81685.1 sorbosone dehydrogenase family protein [Sphingomonas qomolangmaensis]
MRKKLLIALGVLVVLALAVWFLFLRPDVAQLPNDAVMGTAPQISEPREQTFPTIGIAKPVGWEGGKPVAAAGMQVNAFAGDLDHPRWMYRLDNGDVLVAETNSPPREGGGITAKIMGFLMARAGAGVPSANRITLLRDANRDGVAEQRSVLLSGLNSPFGMVVQGDWLYVANTDALVRFPFRMGQTKIDAPAEKIVALPGGGNHWARNVIASPDGEKLFVSVGSASNIAENGLAVEKNRATILEVDPQAKRLRIYAAGLRNPVGMAINPVTQALWTVVNERDMLGSDLPPDYLTQVEFGGFYGWPYSYWGGYTDTRVSPGRPDLREYTRRPDYALGAHTASLGLAFADEVQLGQRFSRGAFIGQHGSWNREPPAGYKVVFVPFGANGYPVAGSKPIDVLTGFLNADDQARGRPVGVIGDRTGALLVADDVGNVIWRVSPAGQSAKH